MKTLLAYTLLITTAVAAEPQIHRDLAYAEPKNERHTLDVYAPAEGRNHPIVIWIYGSGSSKGSKLGVQQKPLAFTEKGFVFVSINYRFALNVSVKEMTGDVSKAIHWVHENAKQYGGDPNSIFVMGYSTGARLAALVCTDDRHLKAEGLSPSILKGCVTVDDSLSNMPMRPKDGDAVTPKEFVTVFGTTEEIRRDFAQAIQDAKGKGIPPFLILHVAERADTKSHANWLAGKLNEAGVSAKVIAAEGKTHVTINSDLGLPDDNPTKEVFDFLERVKKPRTLEFFNTNLQKTMTPAQAEVVFGKADRNIGSGLLIYEYDLDDGSKIRLGFPGYVAIVYAKHVTKDGKTVDLPLK